MKRVVLILLLLLLPAYAYAGSRVTLSGYLKQETSMGLDTFNEVTKFKNIGQISGEYKLSDEVAFFLSGKYWYDAVYGWYDKYDPAQDQMAHIQRTDWLRDCYMDYMRGPWFLRLGRQQVSWGQADGVSILDRVNPVDLTEYWLPDMVDIRIPLWMANINYSPKLNSNLQLLIIPDFEQSTAAPPDAPFAFRSYRLFKTAKDRIEAPPNSATKLPISRLGALRTNYNGRVNTNIYYPGKQLKNTKIGVQWQDRVADWEYTLNYLYGYDYLARTYLDSSSVVVGVPPANVVFNYARRFKIVQLIGGSLNHSFTQEGPLEGLTVRGDLAFYLNEPTYYGDALAGSAKGVNRWNNVFWLVGLDRYFLTKLQVSFQFAQYIMAHKNSGQYDPDTGALYSTLNTYTYGPQDRVENIFVLKLSTTYLNDRLKPEILWSSTDDNQGMLSPKLNYEIMDNLVATLGIYYFYGNEGDSNGEFRDNSQFYTKLKYSF